MSVFTELADRIGLGKSRIAPRLFAMLADETDARILLSLPAATPELAERTGLTAAEVDRRLLDLFLKGVAFPSSKSSSGGYRMCRDFVQFHDATILWKDAPREFLDLWQEFMETEWPEFVRVWSALVPKPFTRVIPVNVSVEAKTHILDFESIRAIVETAEHLAVTPCTCRLTARKCDHALETCVQVNNAALYALKRGTGRKIEKAEALDIFRKAEEEGLIHVTMNRHRVDHFICNCCPCCCQTMPVLIKGGLRVVDPSRYCASVDQALCTGCGRCHERCYFGAVSWTDGEGGISRIDGEKCMGCGLCQVTCPEHAIALVESRPEGFVP